TPNSLSISITGLPTGLALASNNTITGTPSTTLGSPHTLTVTATDPAGLSVNTHLLLTISPATVTNPTLFTITSVNTLSCVTISATERQLTFLPLYAASNGSAITFTALGLLTPTTATGPYTIRVYTDNSPISLQAQQNGQTASFAYNWLAACGAPANTAPTVANVIPPQSATVGQLFTYAIPINTFTDKETPNSLSISVSGLPNGLALVSNNTITGTPSTTIGSPITLTVTATDPAGLSVATPLVLTINPAPTPVNTAPTVANVIPPQSATVGQPFTFAIPASTFTDKETPNSLTITITGLPTGLALASNNTITGTPSTTLGSPHTLTVTATDPAGLSVNTPLLLTISPTPAPVNTAPTVANAIPP
ncbi:putative Ig domain-containing protein, partial [Spirosoma terrae]